MISRLLCWMGFHDWLCLLRWQNKDEYNHCPRSEMTGWVCSRCGRQRTEQWDV